jgi:hypothetical protein
MSDQYRRARRDRVIDFDLQVVVRREMRQEIAAFENLADELQFIRLGGGLAIP